MSNPYAAKTVKPKIKIVSIVPAGSIQDIMSWVDGDSTRASLALDQETSDNGHGRSTLINKLENIING